MKYQDPPGKPYLEVSTKNTEDSNRVTVNSPLIISQGVVTTRPGQEIIFKCNVGSVRSSSPTIIIFKRNGNNVSFPIQYSLNSMTILTKANENGFDYECEAHNDVGSHTSNKISLDIRCK